MQTTTQVAFDVKFDDLFRPISLEHFRDGVVLHGDLLGEPEHVSKALRERFAHSGTTPVLQLGKYGRPQLVLLSTEAPAEGTGRRLWLNLSLFLATLVTTTYAGATHHGVNLLRHPDRFAEGLACSVPLLLILAAHELGHYFAAATHKMKVTLPYFIPAPFVLGTFGAFIKVNSYTPSRRALFDVAIAGPLTGLVLAVPALWFGLTMSEVVAAGQEIPADGTVHGVELGSSILLAVLANFALDDATLQGHAVVLHPLAFAGWIGLLLTALNLLPVGQLDGGHIADAMFGQRRSAGIGLAALAGLVVLGVFVWSGLLLWALLIFLVAGRKGLPPLDDVTKLEPERTAWGWFVFCLLLLILIPVPHALYDVFDIHCPYL